VKIIKFLVLVAVITGLLAGCGMNKASGTGTIPSTTKSPPSLQKTAAQPVEEPAEKNDTRHQWVIKIEQTITAPFMGELGGQDEIISQNTMKLIATNDNDSPYEGKFTGTAYITSIANIKEQLGDPEDLEYLEYKSSHEAHEFTFSLIPQNLASLTRDKGLDERLADVSACEFLMPTEGGNPDNVKGSAMGHQFARADQLDFSLNCSLQQTNNQIELKTDMFGTFTGTISWSAETVELGPLTIDDDFDPAPLVQDKDFDPAPLVPKK
jgi:hypothetical protein